MRLTKSIIAETILKAIGIENIVPGEAESAAEDVWELVDAELAEAKAQIADLRERVLPSIKRAAAMLPMLAARGIQGRKTIDDFADELNELRIALESEGKAAHEQSAE